MTLKDELVRLGLSDKEAEVYLASLELGSSPVQSIAKKANMPRPTVYTQIEELKKLGLMTTVERGKKTYFAAEPPHQLDLVLKRQEDRLSAQREHLSSILAQFEALISFGEKPVVKFYDGEQGLRAMREELLNNPRYDNFLSFTALDDYLAGLPNFEEVQVKRRVQKGKPIRIIYTYSKGKFDWGKGELREVRYLPFEKFPFIISVSICPEMGIQVAKYREGQMGVIIENKQLAQTMQAIFNLCWESAEKYN